MVEYIPLPLKDYWAIMHISTKAKITSLLSKRQNGFPVLKTFIYSLQDYSCIDRYVIDFYSDGLCFVTTSNWSIYDPGDDYKYCGIYTIKESRIYCEYEPAIVSAATHPEASSSKKVFKVIDGDSIQVDEKGGDVLKIYKGE